jgi:hypothetical protein
MHKHQKEIPCSLIAFLIFLGAFFCLNAPASISAQQKNKKSATLNAQTVPPPPPLLTRTTTQHETRRFGYGGTLTIIGAPVGSITIEAWPRDEVDITADIELRADTEEDLSLLAAVNRFVLDEDMNHLRVISTDMHDKVYMRHVAKNFPKRLLGLPWKIDYHIRVPNLIDLEVTAGRGSFNLTGVEGVTKFSALESNATMTLAGGVLSATIGRGAVHLNVASRSWRGNGADVQLATGDLTVTLPTGFSADISADVLRTGAIENTYNTLVPQEHTKPTPHSIRARAGAGGPTFSFTVGDGTLRIKQAGEQMESDQAKPASAP